VSIGVGITATPFNPKGIDLITEAERLGVDSVWTPEAWGYDALTPLAFLAARTNRVRLGSAIVQLGSRSPALLAMSALSLQALSDGRFVLGIGVSGPQVMEGWHGVSFTSPLARTRETIDIIRAATSGQRVSYQGQVYQLPLPGGEGRSIRSAAPPATVPIYVASLGPSNLALTGELADGWIGNSFLPEAAEVFFGPIRRGAQSVGRSLEDLDLTVAVSLEITDDVDEAGRRHARGYAFTFGAMGSKAHNFYKDAFARQGFGDAAAEVQQLWSAGDREAAADRVPLEIGLKTNLLGTADMIIERLRLYRDAGVTTLRVSLPGHDLDTRLSSLATLLDLVNTVNGERQAGAAVGEVES
jgi:F420-dependent oxidoreductase-like protein